MLLLEVEARPTHGSEIVRLSPDGMRSGRKRGRLVRVGHHQILLLPFQPHRSLQTKSVKNRSGSTAWTRKKETHIVNLAWKLVAVPRRAGRVAAAAGTARTATAVALIAKDAASVHRFVVVRTRRFVVAAKLGRRPSTCRLPWSAAGEANSSSTTTGGPSRTHARAS